MSEKTEVDIPDKVEGNQEKCTWNGKKKKVLFRIQYKQVLRTDDNVSL